MPFSLNTGCTYDDDGEETVRAVTAPRESFPTEEEIQVVKIPIDTIVLISRNDDRYYMSSL